MITYLTDDYGYEQYRESGFKTGDIIDASEASWIVANIGDDLNRYPFLIENSEPGLTITGGTIDGEVPLDLDWQDAYVNSAAVLVRDGQDVVIQDWVIDQAWDGIRLNYESDGFLIENCWMTNIRDDAIENDDGSGGTISNCLFDGTFAGISLADEGTPSDAVDKVVKIDNVLLRMETYLYKGEETHFSPLKIEESSPSVEITNSIFAVEGPDHRGFDRQEIGWEKMQVSENNYFLNLSDEPFPDDYPLPGDGWTILQGQEARDHWESAKADWIADFEGDEPDDPEEGPLVDDPVVQDLPPEEPEGPPPASEDPETEEPVEDDPFEPPLEEIPDEPLESPPPVPDDPVATLPPAPEEPVRIVFEDPIDETPVQDPPPEDPAPKEPPAKPEELEEPEDEPQPKGRSKDDNEFFLLKFFKAIFAIFGGGDDDDEPEVVAAKFEAADTASEEFSLADIPIVPLENDSERAYPSEEEEDWLDGA